MSPNILVPETRQYHIVATTSQKSQSKRTNSNILKYFLINSLISIIMSTSLLDRILKLKEPIGFVIIKDTILQSGYLIARELVKGFTSNEKNNVIFLCVESPPQSFLEGIDQKKQIVVQSSTKWCLLQNSNNG